MQDLITKNSNNTITSLELVEQINLFRQQQDGKSELQHKTILDIIRAEFSEEIGRQEILQSSYLNSQNKRQPMYVLTFSQAKQVLVRESKIVRKAVIAYIEKLENKLKQNALPQDYLSALKALVASEEEKIAVQQENKKLESEVSHKKDVIEGLTEDISLACKRQRISQIVRHTKNGNYQDRYKLLYSEFEKKYHYNLSKRMENLNELGKITPKITNKIDYIDRVLGKLPELYELACKLFERDLKDIQKEWENAAEK